MKKLIVISGPSGVGKGTVADILKTTHNDIVLSVSCTTRLARVGEIDGKSYFFITHDEFNNKIKNNGFLEYSEHFGNFYGTPKDFVESQLKERNVLLEIDVNGGINVKKNYPNAVLIFLMPPSKEELIKRLKNRSTETDEQIKLRLSRLEYEISKDKEYDYIVVNDNLDETIKKIENIIKL